MTPLEKIRCFLAESNRIEGYVSNPEQYFTGKIVPQHVDNACAAWREIPSKLIISQQKKLSLYNIKALHRMTMWLFLNEDEIGVYRTCGISVGSYTAPPVSKIRPLMTAFIKRFAEGKTDPLTMHYEFEKIHPFIDGNGRVGRLLWAWDLLRRGKQVRPILDNFDGDDFQERRHGYYDALRAYHG